MSNCPAWHSLQSVFFYLGYPSWDEGSRVSFLSRINITRGQGWLCPSRDSIKGTFTPNLKQKSIHPNPESRQNSGYSCYFIRKHFKWTWPRRNVFWECLSTSSLTLRCQILCINHIGYFVYLEKCSSCYNVLTTAILNPLIWNSVAQTEPLWKIVLPLILCINHIR